MKYCTKCGKKLNKESKFCGNCGEPINNTETKTKNNKIIIIIGCLILFVAVMGIIIIFNILHNDRIEDNYEDFEDALEVATERYISLKNYDLSSNISSIIIEDLVKENLINNDLTNKCEGYVLIQKERDYDDYDYEYDYDAYIKCGDKYESKGYNYTYSEKSYINLNQIR